MKSILEGRPALRAEVEKTAEVAGYLWQNGWAERNGGNITVNITDLVDDEVKAMPAISEVKQIGVTLPYLKGCYFYCKGTGKRMRDLARKPMENGSVIRILDDCASYVIIADNVVNPTSELPSHLSVHNRMIEKGSNYRATVHTHPIELIAMSHTKKFMGKDVLTNILWSMIPEDMKELAQKYHDELIEHVAEQDDALMEKYFAGEELTIDEIKGCIRKSTIANTMVPVTCGTSYRNKGVQKLLDAIVDYMPAPTDVPAIKGINPETEEEEVRHSSDDEPFAALAFKIATDPFVGKLCFCRVYSGTVEAGTTVYNANKDSNERLGRILQMHSNHRKDIEKIYAGDIVAVVGVKNTTTGDTLCDERHPIILESMKFPEPVIRVAIEPKTKAGQEKMGLALAKLAEEDPTFRTYTDEETGQTIIAGMGELHLEIIVDRLLREFKVEANVGAPQVAYKETVRGTADVDCKYARQSGGKGQYGHVKIKLEPNESGKGYEFINAIVGGAIPKEYIPAVDAGIQGAMQAGVLAAYNVVDVKVTLYDGSYHEVDSSEMAFKIAGSMAFKDAMRKADPVLMEPIMKVVVTVPDEYMGYVIGDISSRRGQMQGSENLNGAVQIRAFVPLSEMFGYATDLRSGTQGRGQYVMEPSHYAEVPKSIAEEIISKRSRKED